MRFARGNPSISCLPLPLPFAALLKNATSLQDIELYLQKAVGGFSSVAVPACFTLLVANEDATSVANETYWYTS